MPTCQRNSGVWNPRRDSRVRLAVTSAPLSTYKSRFHKIQYSRLANPVLMREKAKIRANALRTLHIYTKPFLKNKNPHRYDLNSETLLIKAFFENRAIFRRFDATKRSFYLCLIRLIFKWWRPTREQTVNDSCTIWIAEFIKCAFQTDPRMAAPRAKWAFTSIFMFSCFYRAHLSDYRARVGFLLGFCGTWATNNARFWRIRLILD